MKNIENQTLKKRKNKNNKTVDSVLLVHHLKDWSSTNSWKIYWKKHKNNRGTKLKTFSNKQKQILTRNDFS